MVIRTIDVIGFTISITISTICLIDLWRLDTSIQNKCIFSLIVLIPVLGHGFYLVARPDLAKIQHDQEINNYYAKGKYELHNEKLRELKKIKSLEKSSSNNETNE